MAGLKSAFRAIASVFGLAASLVGCSQLGLFDFVSPKDAGSRRIARDIAYGTDARQTLNIYGPDEGRVPAGVVVFTYGGSWSSGTKADYGFVGRAFASRGYLTFVFDYRLVPGVRYPAFVEDNAKAVAWVYRNARTYGGDPGRLFLLGHSAGAYNAMMTAVDPRFLAAEGLSPAILRGAAGLSGPYDFLPLDVMASQEAFAGVANLERTQPVNHVRRDAPLPPIFLATGDADQTVRPRNTRALAAELRNNGKSVQERYYKGVDHVGTLLAISRPLRRKAPVLEDVAAFFAAQ